MSVYRAKVDEWLGGFNDVPPNLKVISEIDFWRLFNDTYPPEYKCSKQISDMNKVSNPEFQGIRKLFLSLWVLPGNKAVGWVNGINPFPDFFVSCCLCEHTFVHTNPKMFQHIYTCEKCGYSFEEDSSG